MLSFHGPMALHPAEEATIRAFVVREKRDRLVSLLSTPKHRDKVMGKFNDFRGWDPRFVQPLPSSANVLSILVKAGATGRCHIISGDRTLDGADLPLAQAVAAAELYSFASILCCVPGQLAFFSDEIYAPRVRLLLRRPDPEVK
jgi:hypothetical protein